jgi:hypothetical protein
MTLITRKPKPTEAVPTVDFDAGAWRDRFEERVGMLEHDAGLSHVEACAIAGQEATHDWMRNNLPDAYLGGRCCHCKRVLDDRRVPVQTTGVGSFVHAYCLYAFVAGWVNAAQSAMLAAGFPKQCVAQLPRPAARIDQLLDAAHAEHKRGCRSGKILMSFQDAEALAKLMQGKLPREAA